MSNSTLLQGLRHNAPIKATAQRLALSPGVYALTVVDGGPAATVEGLPVPSAHVAAVPGGSASVEMVSSVPNAWLTKRGDSLVIKVADAPADLVLTSYKLEDRPDASLGIRMLQLDEAAAPAAPAAAPATAPAIQASVLVHVQNRGDLTFAGGSWAGCVGQRLWIEAFGITLSGGLASEDIEYKALLSSGWETPWIPGGQLCGSRGMGVAVVGFAIRLTGAAAARYDCLYEGAFLSGSRVGPHRGGAPCRSDAVGDPLEGLLFQLVERSPAALPNRRP